MDTLTKIESKLNFFCEARDYLQKADGMLNHNQRPQDKDINTFAKDLDKERKDKIIKEKQNQQKQ